MEITDESLGLAKPKAKPAKGPMRPEHDNVRMKPGLGLKQPPKQRQGLLTNHSKKKELVVVVKLTVMLIGLIVFQVWQTMIMPMVLTGQLNVLNVLTHAQETQMFLT